ncbi:MAG: hypothetical protein AAF183_18780, partial [Pseudomonadota bacterium]
GYIAISGQIVYSTLVAAPKQRNSEDGKARPDIASPSFGSMAHTSINRRHSLIRRWDGTVAAAHDGRMLRHGLLGTTNTRSGVWAASRRLPAIACQPTDSAYRSNENA